MRPVFIALIVLVSGFTFFQYVAGASMIYSDHKDGGVYYFKTKKKLAMFFIPVVGIFLHDLIEHIKSLP